MLHVSSVFIRDNRTSLNILVSRDTKTSKKNSNGITLKGASNIYGVGYRVSVFRWKH